jgi:integrase
MDAVFSDAVLAGLLASVNTESPGLKKKRPARRVRDLARRYLDNLDARVRAGDCSAGHVGQVRHYLTRFVQEFGDRPLKECSNADLTQWLTAHPTWKSDHSRNNALNAVLLCFNWCHDEGLIRYVPYRKKKVVKLRRKPRQPITPDEYRQFMRHARNCKGKRRRPAATALRVAAFFLRNTGARTGEMRAVLFRDVDFEKGVIRLTYHKTDHTGDERLIGLTGHVLRLIRSIGRHRARVAKRRGLHRPCTCPEAEHREHLRLEHVFLNSRGLPWTRSSFGKLFRVFARLAGLPARRSPYCLRHGFAVSAIEAGLSDRAIADQLGHRSTNLIQWYGRGSRQNADHLRAVAERATGKAAAK